MARLYANNYNTALTSTISAADLTMDVDSVTGLPALSGSDYFYLTIDDSSFIEIVKVTSVTVNTLAIERGQEGTAPRAFVGGVDIELRATAASFNVRPEGAKGDGITDDTLAIQGAIDTGLNVDLGPGKFRITNELLITTHGQHIFGRGNGVISPDQKALIGAKTILFIDKADTIPRYIKTRRQARETVADPDDAPLSVVINNQGEAARFYDFAIELDCDYTDMSPTNLGGDCDVALFNGCRGDVKPDRITVLGYFRVASYYLDVTGTTTLPQFTTPGGIQYPPVSVGGSDRVELGTINCKGGLKAVFLAGAKESANGNYYDGVSGTTTSIQGSRGGSGASDFRVHSGSYLESREHHSGYRATDPLMDTSAEDIDLIAAVVAIDGRRGSTAQGRIRRQSITDTRMRTIEAARIFTDRAYELNINWVHTEAKSGTVRNTSGVVIDQFDYDNHSYGSVACVPTSGTEEGTDQVSSYGLWGTRPVPAWSSDLVDNFSAAQSYPTSGDWIPEFIFDTGTVYTEQYGRFTRVDDVFFCDFKITYNSLSLADNSSITITNLPATKDGNSSFQGALNFTDSTGFVASTGESVRFSDDTSISRFRVTKGDGSPYTYSGGEIQSSGVLQGSFWYRGNL